MAELAGPIVFAVAAALALGTIPPATAQQKSSPQKQNLDWPFYGNNPGGMRYQNIDQINASNVKQLKPAWILHTNVVSKQASFEDQPIVRDGLMFVTSPEDHVFALNPATGAIKWTYSPTGMPKLSDLALCCGIENRGVAVGDGKVFVARLDDKLVALDEQTGEPVWTASVADWHQKWTETMAPLFIDGKVIIGGSGGEFERRGFVAAYDAKTGKQMWRFHTIPGPGQPGHDTWAGNSWRTGGGVVWTTPMADPKLGLLYITTGNAAPDLNGSQRAGDNLYASSIVAIDPCNLFCWRIV